MITKNKKTPLLATLIVGLEYFDYIIFPMLGSVFIQVFFQNQYNLWYVNFLFFSLGSFIKIFGAIIFGYLFDTKNKTKIIQILAITMIISTSAIAFLPKFETTSIWIYFSIFFIARIAQALSFGADLPTTTTYIYELNENSSKNISKVIMSATIGAIIAIGCINILTVSITKQQLLKFGWRIPLILSTFIGILSFVTRMKKLKENHEPKIETQFEQVKLSTIVKLMLILLFPLALWDLNTYFPFYMSTFMNIPITKIYQYQFVSMICSAIFNIIFMQIKNINIQKTYSTIAITFILLAPFASIFAKNHPITFLIAWQFFITISIICAIYIVLSQLKIKMKSLTYGVIYNMNFLLTSFIPVLFIKLRPIFNSISIPFYLTAITGIIGLICNKKLQKKDHSTL